MRLSSEPGFRDFWYPVAPLDLLATGPRPFTLLGERIALWLDDKGRPAAVKDRCPHRSARLSSGRVEKGSLTCPYHAWAFGPDGQCNTIPQYGDRPVAESCRVEAFRCDARYGYAWVCLGTPRLEIPSIPEFGQKGFRFFPCFYETWNTTSLRVIENELDMAHFAVVHRGTFGDPATPNPLELEVRDIDPYSLHVSALLSVRPAELQRKNTREKAAVSTRRMEIGWRMPFFIRLDMTYPSGLRHIIINHPTPIDDEHIQVVQFCLRTDTEKEAPQKQVLEFERLILNEDRGVLELTDCDVPLDTDAERHMPTDKPGLLVRRKLAAELGVERPQFLRASA